MFGVLRHAESSRTLEAPTLESEPATFRVLAAERAHLAGFSLLLRTVFDRSSSDESESSAQNSEPSFLSLLSRAQTQSKPQSVSVLSTPKVYSSSSQSVHELSKNFSDYAIDEGDRNGPRGPRHDWLSARQRSDNMTSGELYDMPLTTATTTRPSWTRTELAAATSASASNRSSGSTMTSRLKSDFDTILRRRLSPDAMRDTRDAMLDTRERMERQHAISSFVYTQLTPAIVALGIISNAVALLLILRATRSRSRYRSITTRLLSAFRFGTRDFLERGPKIVDGNLTLEFKNGLYCIKCEIERISSAAMNVIIVGLVIECRSVSRSSGAALYLWAYCVACVLQLALLPGAEWLAVTAAGRHASDIGGHIACRVWYLLYGIFYSYPTWIILPPVISIGMSTAAVQIILCRNKTSSVYQ